MRKFWKKKCPINFDFSEEDIKEIEKKYNVLVIPFLVERIVEELFDENYKKMGFDRIGFEPNCFQKIYKRLGRYVNFGCVDRIAWKNNEPYTVELETWASFARFHDYMYYLDYIVALQKDDWYGGYGNVKVIELWKVLGVKEIILRENLENFLYEVSEDFRSYCDEVFRRECIEQMKMYVNKYPKVKASLAMK